MATALINDSDTAVRVGPDDRRFPPRAVLELDGKEASDARKFASVREATKEEQEAHTASLQGPTDSASRSGALADTAAAARRTARGAVAGDLATVIGDDDAPHGPGTGTITTKQAAARVSQREKEAFADNEHLPEDAEDRNLSGVQAAQARNAGAVEQIAAELVGVEPGASADEDAGQSEGRPADPNAGGSATPVDELKGEALDAEVKRLDLDLPSKATADEKRQAIEAARS